MNKKIAEITIDLYQQGLIARCEELEMESLCADGDALMDFLNEVQGLTDPNAEFRLTEKGRRTVELLNKFPDASLDEINEIIKQEENGV